MEGQIGGQGPAQAVLSWLGRLEVGAGIAFDRLVVLPAFGQADAALDYRTLAEAVAEGWAEVAERPAPTVPELLLRNRGKSMLLVLDGEEIIGGKQNRIVNASFLIAPGAQVTLPVSCVEHGRWHGSSPRFEVGEASFASLRAAKAEQVHVNMRALARPLTDQGAIWDQLADRHAAAASHSPTGAMRDLYESRGETLSAYERNLPYVDGACGLIVGVNGRVVGADLFDQARTSAQLWTRLIRSYALDAMEGDAGRALQQAQAIEFLARSRDAHCEVYPSLGLGDSVQLDADDVVGSALVYQGIPVHVALFQRSGRSREQDPSGIARASVRRALRGRRSAGM